MVASVLAGSSPGCYFIEHPASVSNGLPVSSAASAGSTPALVPAVSTVSSTLLSGIAGKWLQSKGGCGWSFG